MNYDYEQTEFSKSLLAGVFGGIAATVISLLYNALFRAYTGFPLTDMVNVSTIIFALVLLVSIAGMIFYLFHHYFKKGAIIYQLAGIIITILLIAGAMQVVRSANPILSKEFRGLILGIITITGVCSVFIVPFLFKRNYI